MFGNNYKTKPKNEVRYIILFERDYISDFYHAITFKAKANVLRRK